MNPHCPQNLLRVGSGSCWGPASGLGHLFCCREAQRQQVSPWGALEGRGGCTKPQPPFGLHISGGSWSSLWWGDRHCCHPSPDLRHKDQVPRGVFLPPPAQLNKPGAKWVKWLHPTQFIYSLHHLAPWEPLLQQRSSPGAGHNHCKRGHFKKQFIPLLLPQCQKIHTSSFPGEMSLRLFVWSNMSWAPSHPARTDTRVPAPFFLHRIISSFFASWKAGTALKSHMHPPMEDVYKKKNTF